MKKDYSNKEIKSNSEKKSDKALKTYSFKGNPPVSIKAKSRPEAEEEFNKLKK